MKKQKEQNQYSKSTIQDTSHKGRLGSLPAIYSDC